MDLTPGRARLLFAVIVIALVGLGAYLITSRHSGNPSAGPAAATGPSPSAAAPGTAYVPPSAVPSASPVSTAGGAEIYQWLPFTPAELSQAASTADAFAAAYATWSYTESAAAYGARLQHLVTPLERATLENGYSTAGVAQPRTADKQVSTGSGSIERIFAFGSGTVSITFVVQIDQLVTSHGSTPDDQVSHWDVTVVQSGSGWLVSDLELEGLGNQGQGSTQAPGSTQGQGNS